MSNIRTVLFNNGVTTQRYYGVRQWDYGQILRIQGLKLNPFVDFHFSLQEYNGTSVSRVGVTKDGVTDVVVPDSFLENEGVSGEFYYVYVFIYVTGEDFGQTEYKIKLRVETRPKPEVRDTPEGQGAFAEAMRVVNESANRAEDAADLAKSWAVGDTGTREGENTDNAKFYANQAKDALKEVSGEVEDAKKHIDAYCVEKEHELRGDTGNVYFAAFKVVNGRLLMYSDPNVDKVRFLRVGSRMKYRLAF